MVAKWHFRSCTDNSQKRMKQGRQVNGFVIKVEVEAWSRGAGGIGR